MSRIDQLLEKYREHVSLPLRPNLSLKQRTWFLVYGPEDERRMANRIPEFEILTRDAGLLWHRIGLAGAFADWMDSVDPDEREACLADPEIAEEYADPGFRTFLANRVHTEIAAIPPAEAGRTVTALTGLMDLYDFIHVSSVLEALDSSFPGVLLVFFPGERVENTYRFLDARDGWDYLAVPILAES
jgi:hypothetical protein